jgi:hypothetical protein
MDMMGLLNTNKEFGKLFFYKLITFDFPIEFKKYSLDGEANYSLIKNPIGIKRKLEDPDHWHSI